MTRALQLLVIDKNLLRPSHIAGRTLEINPVGAQIDVNVQPVFEHVQVLVAEDLGLDGAMLLEVNYRVRDTYHERSIVYPFYLSGEQEPGEE